MIWTLLACISMLLLTLHLLWKFWIFYFKLSNVAGPPTIPMLGCIPYLPDTLPKFFDKLNEWDQNWKSYCLWYGPLPILRSINLAFAEEVLKSNVLITKSFFYSFGHAWFGNSVLTLTGSEWKHRRNLVNRAFQLTVIKNYTEVFKRHATSLNLKLMESIGKPIDIQTVMSDCSLGVICETAMGINNTSLSYKEYSDALTITKYEFETRVKKPWLWADFFFKLSPSGKRFYKNVEIMENFTIKVINGRIKKRLENTTQKTSYIIDVLLDAYDKGEIDVPEIVREVSTYMFAGHDTTSTALSWTFYFLGLYPEVQNKLYKEILMCKNESDAIIDQIAKTEYLEMVIKESLRLRTPVTTFGRAIETNTKINGIDVAKGTTIEVSSYGIHRDSDIWPSPDEFNPERFNKVNSLNRRPFTFLPFSAGPRNCVGQKFAMLKMKTFIFEVLSKFDIVTIKQDIQECSSIILCSLNGIWLEFNERTQ